MSLGTTNNSPQRHSDHETNLGYAYVFAAAQIEQELHDMLDPFEASLQVASLVGDASQSGSDVLRVTYIGGVGMQRTMTALASETDAAPLASIRTGYSSLTVAPYGIADSETYFQQALNREPAVSLDAIVAQTPGTVAATIRNQICAQGAAITANTAGAAGTQLSVDDMLDLMALARSAFARGPLTGMVHPKQINDLIESMRAEPGFQGSAADFERATSLPIGVQVVPNVLGLRLTLGITGDVDTSGGAHMGFVTDPGGIGWGRASTAPVRPANTVGAIYIPEFGVLIEESMSAQNNQQRRVNAYAYLGFALADSSVKFQSILRSVT